MLNSYLKKWSTGFLCSSILMLGFNPVFAATIKNLRHQPLSTMNAVALSQATSAIRLEEKTREVDFKNQLHVRLQETYRGTPVWGADVAVHLPVTQKSQTSQPLQFLLANAKSSMNGILYENLDADLQGAPAFIFTTARAEQAVAQALRLYQQKTGDHSTLTAKEARLIIYVDQKQKAHWAYRIQLTLDKPQGLPARPCYLMDASNLEVYRTWNNIQTREPLDNSYGGGFGGNKKTGKLTYDGLSGHFASLSIRRDSQTRRCYLENAEVVVKDARKNDAISQFICNAPDAQHNQLFWNSSLDAVNGAYSPSNDALFVGKVIKDMYLQWYDIPVLTQNGRPMKLVMRVHEDMDNAYWDGKQMTFGDGVSQFYPLVSLGVGAHEVSHGFTEQHAGLIYDGQSGGLNESFSDMAAQAAEYFIGQKNTWQIGAEIVKDDEPLRYMDRPTLDCAGKSIQDQCSIDNANDYYPGIDVHFSSGVFNRAFYLLATASGWSPKKAFDVMVHANRFYWTQTTDFMEAACSVMDSIRDYGYNNKAAITAFKKVGIPVGWC